LQPWSRLLGAAFALALGSGCAINGTRPLPEGAAPSAGRAVIVYGVGVDSKWDYEGFTVQLTEYSLPDGNMTGNCFRFNRTEATVAPAPGPVRRFAFEVAPGHYVYSPFNGAPLPGPAIAYSAPANRTVFIGDFIYGKDKQVSLRRDPLPGTPLAEVRLVASPKPFLCTP
jgi:hypothetical protein